MHTCTHAHVHTCTHNNTRTHAPRRAVLFCDCGCPFRAKVVSINYRLTGDYWDWTTEQMILDAAEDARAAVRWVRSVAEDQKIDTDRVSIIGESAGAWTALFVGYVGKAKHEGNSGNPGYPSQPNGIVSISGELKGQGFCKSVHPKPTGCQVDVPNDETNDLTGADGQPPLLMLHGTEDTIVPYVNGKAVYDRAQSVGLVSSFISLQGAPHVPWDVIFNQSDYWQQTMQNMWIGLNLANAEAPAGCTPQTIRTFADGSDASTKDGGIAATAAAAATAARDNATALRVIRTAQSRAAASANCSGEVASAYIDTNVGGPCATTDRSGARLIDYGYNKVGLTLPATAAGLCKSGSAASAANFSNLATGWVVGDVACFSGSDGAAGAAAVGGFVRGGAIGAGSLVICTGASYERVDRTSTNYNYWASHFVGTRRLCS